MNIEQKTEWGIFGNRITQKRARAALPILIRYAQKKSPITFKELGNAVGIFKAFHLRMGKLCGCINTELKWLTQSDAWAYEENPILTAIVVDRNGMPSSWMKRRMREQKIETNKEMIEENYDRYFLQPVYKYQHWGQVIDAIIKSPKW